MSLVERYREGDTVLVREDYPIGHFRTPVYIRGKKGLVTKRYGAWGNPETLAYGFKGDKKYVYEVRFRQADVWPDYNGDPNDVIDLDLMDNWLLPADGKN
jgi:nitrile hydratase subunit beta